MPPGRPSSYKPEYAKIAAAATRAGLTDKELADVFEVSERTIHRWKLDHEDFCQSLKIGKDVADDRVERSLFQMAIGYEQEEVKIFMPAGATEPVYAPYTAKVAPSPTAAIFWLKNRRKDEWRDKREDDAPKDDMGDVIRDLIAKLPG